eukprot:347075-Chlamydomonas_euryale.AAC.10
MLPSSSDRASGGCSAETRPRGCSCALCMQLSSSESDQPNGGVLGSTNTPNSFSSPPPSDAPPVALSVRRRDASRSSGSALLCTCGGCACGGSMCASGGSACTCVWASGRSAGARGSDCHPAKTRQGAGTSGWAQSGLARRRRSRRRCCCRPDPHPPTSPSKRCRQWSRQRCAAVAPSAAAPPPAAAVGTAGLGASRQWAEPAATPGSPAVASPRPTPCPACTAQAPRSKSASAARPRGAAAAPPLRAAAAPPPTGRRPPAHTQKHAQVCQANPQHWRAAPPAQMRQRRPQHQQKASWQRLPRPPRRATGAAGPRAEPSRTEGIQRCRRAASRTRSLACRRCRGAPAEAAVPAAAAFAAALAATAA